MNPFKWIFFDLDGTLADSIPALYGCYYQFLEEFQIEGSPEEFHRLNGPSLKEVVQVLATTHQLPGSTDDHLKRYTSIIAARYASHILPRPGSRTLLPVLQNKGYKLALVTSASAEIATSFLDAFQWHDFFQCIITSDMIFTSKPDPEIYILACTQTSANKASVLVIEDSINGVRSAEAAGLDCLELVPGKSLFDQVMNALNEDSSPYPAWEIVSIGNPELRQQQRPPLHEFDAKSEALWQQEKQRKPSLFNGQLFSIASFESTKNPATICGNFVPYKSFITQRLQPQRDGGIRPLGVSALTTFMENEIEYIAFGTRALTVTHYPGYIELLPSGTLDDSTLQADGSIDFKQQIRVELLEECGLNEDCIESIEAIFVQVDHRDCAYDICCVLRLNVSVAILEAAFETAKEYSALHIIPRHELAAFIERNKVQMVPASCALLEFYGTGKE